MPRPPALFVFRLSPEEWAHLRPPVGSGGHQMFHTWILNGADLTVKLDDAALGKLVRYMTQYGSGGFQGRLRKAFSRSLLEQLQK